MNQKNRFLFLLLLLICCLLLSGCSKNITGEWLGGSSTIYEIKFDIWGKYQMKYYTRYSNWEENGRYSVSGDEIKMWDSSNRLAHTGKVNTNKNYSNTITIDYIEMYKQ